MTEVGSPGPVLTVAEEHPILTEVLEATARISGASLATDLRHSLRAGLAKVRVCGLGIPSVPPFGAQEGLAILKDLALSLDARYFHDKTRGARLDWSARIFRTAGRAFVQKSSIELSWPLYCEAGILAMGVILAHELIHLWLHARSRPCGHTAEFGRKSRALGLPEIRHHLDPAYQRHRFWRLGSARAGEGQHKMDD